MAYFAAPLGGLGCGGNRQCAGCRSRNSGAGCAACGKAHGYAGYQGGTGLAEWYVADDDSDGGAPRRLSGGERPLPYYAGKRVIRPLIVR
jgi:hypothetical protein